MVKSIQGAVHVAIQNQTEVRKNVKLRESDNLVGQGTSKQTSEAKQTLLVVYNKEGKLLSSSNQNPTKRIVG